MSFWVLCSVCSFSWSFIEYNNLLGISSIHPSEIYRYTNTHECRSLWLTRNSEVAVEVFWPSKLNLWATNMNRRLQFSHLHSCPIPHGTIDVHFIIIFNRSHSKQTQINKILATSFIIESVTEVLGPTELYIECGSTINLTCVIRESPEPPAYIIWTHNNMVSSERLVSLAVVALKVA